MNNLTTNPNNIISIIEEHGITDLIQPLIKEIYLFDTYIAGTSYVEERSILENLKENDQLILRRDTQNEYDERAILILTQNKQKLGFIPRKDNIIFSRLMDAGKLLTANIKEITLKRNYYYITININLIDF